MPDIVSVLSRRWKLIATLTLGATILAFLFCLASPKKYLGMTTALAANPVTGDKARIFNQNIDALYPELGSPDELDRIEGTAKLDTIYLAAAKDFRLAAHYGLDTTETTALINAARVLKQNTTINRTGYGELRIKVWDKDNTMAASLANALLQTLNDIHQHLQTENNRMVLQRLKEDYRLKQQALNGSLSAGDSSEKQSAKMPSEKATFATQLQQYSQLINEYELALKTAPRVLLVVEAARPLPWPDKPATVLTVVLSFLSSFLFSFLLAVFIESRSAKA